MKKEQTYFKGWVVHNSRAVPYVIWDGVDDYRQPPFRNLVEAELSWTPDGQPIGKRLVIAEIGSKRDTEKFAAVVTKLAATTDAFVFIAQNHDTYRRLVRAMEERADFRRRPDGRFEPILRKVEV
jgi:hypothetical protein